MTRKQAIYQAIQALSAQEGKEEAIALLQDLYQEMPLIHWSDKSIRDAVEQFIADNNRIPTAPDFRKKAMPPHTVIQRTYVIPLAEWLRIHYPQPPKNTDPIKAEHTQRFIETYQNLMPRSSKEFNRRRPQGTLGWATIAQYNGCSNWTSLLNKLRLPSYAHPASDRTPQPINLTVFHDLFD